MTTPTRKFTLAATALAVLAAVALGAYQLGQRSAHGSGGVAAAASAAGAAASAERKVLYWHDPMVPGQRFDKPGKSPFMNMQLVPVYADEAGAGASEAKDSGVRISPQVQQNLGLRTASVARLETAPAIEAVGAVQFDERLVVAVQTRVAGFVEKLAVRAPMERVAKGQLLATVYAPDWLAPLGELAALKKAGAAPELLAAALARCQALSIPAELIARAEQGQVEARFPLHAPAGGVIAELGVREGVAVSPGMSLFRIAGLERVWAVAELGEAQVLQLRRGQKVSATLQADPTVQLRGSLQEILPQVNPATRTLQARFELGNPQGKLVPGMLMRLAVAGDKASRLMLPAEAVIRTGSRVVVILKKPSGAFEPREVQLGAEQGELVELRSGLAEGEQVVVSGQFLIDSEARLRTVLGSLAEAPGAASTSTMAPAKASTLAASAAMPAPGATPAPAHEHQGATTSPSAQPRTASAPADRKAGKGATPSPTYTAEGVIESIEATEMTITHGPVPALKWPGMTMGFNKPRGKALAGVKPGDRIHFEFRQAGDDWEIVSMHRMGAKP